MSVRDRLASLPGTDGVRRLLRGPRPTLEDYHSPVLEALEGNRRILHALRSDCAFMVGRCGGPETACCVYYLKHRQGRLRKPYGRHLKHLMSNNSGFFPADNASLDRFSEAYLDAIACADVMGVWRNIGEQMILKQFCPSAELVLPRSVEPYYHATPWSSALAGRRVLVVHPFASTIAHQYRVSRSRIFEDATVLPEFELLTLQAVQSAAGEDCGYDSWFTALKSMCTSMDCIDYDIALVGAGAYGLPLAAHARRSGKQAVHLGGATQILFGIKGRRWDTHEVGATFYNEHWVRPAPTEVPKGAARVEGACYW